MSDIVLE